MTPIVIVGAGGQARVVAAALRQTGEWKLVGVLDDKPGSIGEPILDSAVVGTYDDLVRLVEQGIRHAFPALGDNNARMRLFRTILASGFDIPVLIHPHALVDRTATVGRGTFVCAGAIIGVEARVGENCLINTGAIIEHETIVADGAHVAPGCRIGGRARVGERVFVGLGSTIKDKISIGSGSTIGAGSVVVRDIPADVVAYGVPARVVRSINQCA